MQILEGAFGNIMELKNVKNQLKFPMIGDLVKIIDGAKLFEQNGKNKFEKGNI
jgi:hypothetical protein